MNVYAILLDLLSAMTGVEWRESRNNGRVRYLTQSKLAINVGIYKPKKYSSLRKYSLDILIVVCSQSGFTNRREWLDSMGLELKHKLLSVLCARREADYYTTLPDSLELLSMMSMITRRLREWKSYTTAAPVYIQWLESAAIQLDSMVEYSKYTLLCNSRGFG
jgi:hypothetical protein